MVKFSFIIIGLTRYHLKYRKPGPGDDEEFKNFDGLIHQRSKTMTEYVPSIYELTVSYGLIVFIDKEETSRILYCE